MTIDPWPWPGDTELERARRLALGYREALLSAAPALAARLDIRAVEWGQQWVSATRTAWEPDDLLTVREVADWAGVVPRTVHSWLYERSPLLPAIRTPDGVRIRFAALLDWDTERRRRRGRARGGELAAGTSP